MNPLASVRSYREPVAMMTAPGSSAGTWEVVPCNAMYMSFLTGWVI
jgi:hypothetical protein